MSEKKITGRDKFRYGRIRPDRGPYPPGVFNGPHPYTARGRRRREERTRDIPKDQVAIH